MIKEDTARRTFLKKTAAAVGVVAAADYTKTLISSPAGSTDEGNAKYACDVNIQERILSQKQLVLMTDNEKKQRLDELLNNYHKALT